MVKISLIKFQLLSFKYTYCLLFFVLLSNVLLGQRASSFPSDKVYVPLLNHASPMASMGLGYEKYVSPTRALDFELAYIYNSWFTRRINGVIARATTKNFLKEHANGKSYSGTQFVLQYHQMRKESIFAFFNEAYFQIADSKRNKIRFAIMGHAGREWHLGHKLYADISISGGGRLDHVWVKHEVEGGTFFRDRGNILFVRNPGFRFYPDANVAFKLKYAIR